MILTRVEGMGPGGIQFSPKRSPERSCYPPGLIRRRDLKGTESFEEHITSGGKGLYQKRLGQRSLSLPVGKNSAGLPCGQGGEELEAS